MKAQERSAIKAAAQRRLKFTDKKLDTTQVKVPRTGIDSLATMLLTDISKKRRSQTPLGMQDWKSRNPRKGRNNG